ncbi:MAG: Ig domain-containing protein [Abditibacteriota bacterium]|nr:Ig domain-containing protein [Abditibacteriota bacterium]
MKKLTFLLIILTLCVSLVYADSPRKIVQKDSKATIRFSTNNITIKVGETYKIEAHVTNKASKESIKWSTNNPDVATVDKSGKVKGIGAGSAIITGKLSSSNSIATCSVHVKNKNTKSSISLNKSSITLNIGDWEWIKATTTNNKAVRWASTNNSIATVDSEGKVVGKKAGNATIIATTYNGESFAECKVVVKNKKSNKVTLNKKSITLSKGSTYDLYNTSNVSGTLTWSSSNSSIAMVDKYGKVTARSNGTCTIYCKSKNSGQDSCKVTVGSKTIYEASDIHVDVTNIDLFVGDFFALGDLRGIREIRSSNTNVATIEGNYIIARRPGTCQIIIKDIHNDNDHVLINVVVSDTYTSNRNYDPRIIRRHYDDDYWDDDYWDDDWDDDWDDRYEHRRRDRDNRRLHWDADDHKWEYDDDDDDYWDD